MVEERGDPLADVLCISVAVVETEGLFPETCVLKPYPQV